MAEQSTGSGIFINKVYFWYTMSTTTIKVHTGTKLALDELGHEQESYDEVIARLIAEVKKKHARQELIEAYTSKKREDKQMVQEWERASAEVL